ncbi:MAG: hypothetical protein FJX59_14345 [Alphaproteobacteria bacterium]|nr:hypothetical protein [Alphaproteobacteria bacterium]
MATDTKRLGAEADYIKHDADNMVLLGNPHIDNLLTMVIALGAEMWQGQQRMKIMEALLTKHGKVTTEMIEQYVPTEAEAAKWAAERKAMVDRIYSVMTRNTTAARTFGSIEPNIERK